MGYSDSEPEGAELCGVIRDLKPHCGLIKGLEVILV